MRSTEQDDTRSSQGVDEQHNNDTTEVKNVVEITDSTEQQDVHGDPTSGPATTTTTTMSKVEDIAVDIGGDAGRPSPHDVVNDMEMHVDDIKPKDGTGDAVAGGAEELYCACGRVVPDTIYLGCDHCDVWVHAPCAGVSLADSELIESWTCPACRALDRGDVVFKPRCAHKPCSRVLPVASRVLTMPLGNDNTTQINGPLSGLDVRRFCSLDCIANAVLRPTLHRWTQDGPENDNDNNKTDDNDDDVKVDHNGNDKVNKSQNVMGDDNSDSMAGYDEELATAYDNAARLIAAANELDVTRVTQLRNALARAQKQLSRYERRRVRVVRTAERAVAPSKSGDAVCGFDARITAQWLVPRTDIGTDAARNVQRRRMLRVRMKLRAQDAAGADAMKTDIVAPDGSTEAVAEEEWDIDASDDDKSGEDDEDGALATSASVCMRPATACRRHREWIAVHLRAVDAELSAAVRVVARCAAEVRAVEAGIERRVTMLRALREQCLGEGQVAESGVMQPRTTSRTTLR